MKRLVSLLMMLIVLVSSSTFALIDTSKKAVFDGTLSYTDLQTPVFDRYGRQERDRTTGQGLYTYHYAVNEIMKASSIGLIQGYDDGTFKPDASITKAEFIKLAIVLSTNRNFDFSAIPTSIKHWSAPYIAVAEMQGVIEKGEYNDKNLDEPITRIEMICILSKIQIQMKGVSQFRDAELRAYTDINDLTEEEKELLLHASKYELIAGMFETDTIRPYDNLTRGDATIAIMRIY